jgi:hypothetical protein
MVKCRGQRHVGVCQKDMGGSDGKIMNSRGMNDERLALKNCLIECLLFPQFLIVGEQYLGRIGLTIDVDEKNFLPRRAKPAARARLVVVLPVPLFERRVR